VKRILLPRRLDYKTLREEPQRLVGYTGDGHVLKRGHYPTMYVHEIGSGTYPTALRGHRVCEPCMRPDLHAAVTGLSLIASDAGKP
jgi:hypothetical protein